MKRFTETLKWSDPWFRALPIESKCLWLWLLDNCDCAGIIDPDLELASFQIGAREGLQSPLQAIGDRVQQHGSKLFIPKFIPYQYGNELNLANTAHRGVIKRLEMAKIPSPVMIVDNTNKAPSKPLQRGLQGPQDKDKDKDKVKITKKIDYSYIEPLAELIWNSVPPISRERSSRAKLEKALMAINKVDLPSLETLEKALKAWNMSQKWTNGYAEGCHIWLNEKQWLNLPQSTKVTQQPQTPKHRPI